MGSRTFCWLRTAPKIFADQVRPALIKSRASIDDLIATLRKRLMGSPLLSNDKDAA
jgi:hypothetical protein